MNAAIVCKDIVKIYNSRKKKVTALNRLNLTVKEGEVFGLLGPNGAGKMTLLKATEGHATVGGYDVDKEVFFLPMFCAGLYFTMETLSSLGLLLGLAATIVSVAASSQLGVIFASLVLRYREITAIFGFFNFAFQMLSGMFVPFQLLPLPLRIIGYCLPSTFGMDLMRHYVMGTTPILPIIYEWAASSLH